MARITGQKGNPGAKSIHRKIVRASLVSMPGWAWNLSISVGRDLRDPPARPSPGAQICSALAHTPAWLLPPSAVSSLDRPLPPLIGASSQTRARNCPSHPGPQPPTPRAWALVQPACRLLSAFWFPGSGCLPWCTLLFLLDPHQSISVPRKVWCQKTKLAKMLLPLQSCSSAHPFLPTVASYPFPGDFSLQSQLSHLQTGHRPLLPCSSPHLPVLKPLHLLCSRGPRARAPSWHSPAC